MRRMLRKPQQREDALQLTAGPAFAGGQLHSTVLRYAIRVMLVDRITES